MTKNKKIEIIVLLIGLGLLLSTIYVFFPLFSFHTYDKSFLSNYIINTEDENMDIENMQVYIQDGKYVVGGGRLTVTSEELLTKDKEYILSINLLIDNEEVSLDYPFKLDSSTYEFELQTIDSVKSDASTFELTKSVFTINEGETVIKEESGLIHECVSVAGTTKEYRLENTYISETFMRLGKLEIADDISKYTDIALEYRYKTTDDYEVFERVAMPIEEYQEIDNSLYYVEDRIEDFSFFDKELSVVVILSNDKEEYVFAINLSPIQGGQNNEES